MLDPVLNLHERGKHASAPIGLIPAAGKATRLNPLPFSKELYPIESQWMNAPHRFHPKPVCVSLLEKMKLAGVQNTFIVLRKGKWDIPAFLAGGEMLGMHLAYLIMNLPYGVPFTLDQAYAFIKNDTVIFGFPDILFYPHDAFCRLLARQDTYGADIVLGLFPVSHQDRMDMVELDGNGRIGRIHIKPGKKRSDYPYTWIIASWGPAFTEFMHSYVSTAAKQQHEAPTGGEICFSDIINAGLKKDIRVDHVAFDDGRCLDIGTTDNLARAALWPQLSP